MSRPERPERPELDELVEELHEVKTKWFNIGIQLKVPVYKLKEIETNTNNNVERAFCEMIVEWLKSKTREPTWADIVKALRSRSVDEQRLAENLERRFCAPPAEPNNLEAVATRKLIVPANSLHK